MRELLVTRDGRRIEVERGISVPVSLPPGITALTTPEILLRVGAVEFFMSPEMAVGLVRDLVDVIAESPALADRVAGLLGGEDR